MCTAKIPPRPRLFLLAALFLLAGCSPQYSMRVISETDGHAYPNDQYTYYIASSKKQNSDPTYQLLKQDVKSTLSEAGFALTHDRTGHGTPFHRLHRQNIHKAHHRQKADLRTNRDRRKDARHV